MTDRGRPRAPHRPTGGKPSPQRTDRSPAPAPSDEGQKDEPGLAVRRHAVEILSAVLDDGRPLDQALEHRAGIPSWRALSPADRALARAIVSTALRRLGLVDDALKRLMTRPLPAKALPARQILRIGATQVLFMDTPDHAAVSLATELASRDRQIQPWKALVNGVLRNLVRERANILAEQDADRLVTPPWLWRDWCDTWGEETARAFGHAHAIEPALDLSVKSDPEGWAERFGGMVLPTGSVRFVAHGAIDKMEGFEAGEWWVQDAAAALPARLLGDVAGLRVADLCAAPGGKSAQLASRGALVTAVDISTQRLERLKQNVARLRLTDVTTIAADLSLWAPTTPFDAILLDAPCSATGTIRRNPDVGRLKKAQDVEGLEALQAHLLERAAAWLKPDGVMVYCTCSLQKAEGETRIAEFLADHPDWQRVPVTADEIGGLAEAITPDGDLRTRPDFLPNDDPRLGGLDGFYAARLRRRAK